MLSLFENTRESYEGAKTLNLNRVGEWKTNTRALFRWILVQPGGKWAWENYASTYRHDEFSKVIESFVVDEVST